MSFLFRNWPAYLETRKFRIEINQLIKNNFPKEEKFLLIDQIKRATNSILLNIAEGAHRTTDRDTNSFINRALTSLNEVVACLDCALDDNYITIELHEQFLNKAELIAKQLKGFSNHLLKN